MRKFKVTFFLLTVALALSGCGIFGGSDGTDVSVAENVEAQPTVNSVQAVPAETPAGDGVEPLTAPADAALPTAVTLPTAAPTPEPTVDRSQPTTYIVKSGDVLGLIAERFDADIAELRRVNNLDGNLIRVGQELIIPALDGSTTTTAGGGQTASGSAAAPAPAATRAPARTVSCSNAGSGHCIQPGDSLAGIAFKYSVTVDALRAANPSVAGDLILSGQVLNLPGGPASPVTPTNPTAPTSIVPAGTPSAPGPVGATSDAECKARNPLFPFYHGTDGLCYANAIGPSAVPTVAAQDPDGCPAGRFLWTDGLCYIDPRATVVPTVVPTAGTGVLPNYGTAPCRDGYLPLEGGRCWPAPDTTPSTVVPVTQATATTTAGSTSQCVEPNFFLNGTSCFLLPDGAAKGCSIEGNVPRCPAT